MLHSPLLRLSMATFAEEGNMRAGVSCFTFHRSFSGLDWMLGFWLFLVVCWFLGRLLFFVWLCFVMPIQYQDHRVYHDFVGISKTATVVTMSKGSKKRGALCIGWHFGAESSGGSRPTHSLATILRGRGYNSCCYWFCKHFPGVLPLSDQNSLQEWISFVAVDQTWCGRVKKVAKAALSHLRLNAEGKVWQLAALARLAKLDCYQAPPVVSEEAHWQCETCSLQFKSKRALAMHSSKVQGYVRRSKYLLDSDVCHACLRKYHTLARALTHLDHNPHCAAVLEANFGFMSEAEVAASDEALREQAL